MDLTSNLGTSKKPRMKGIDVNNQILNGQHMDPGQSNLMDQDIEDDDQIYEEVTKPDKEQMREVWLKQQNKLDKKKKSSQRFKGQKDKLKIILVTIFFIVGVYIIV